jgi:hypothetical protein
VEKSIFSNSGALNLYEAAMQNNRVADAIDKRNNFLVFIYNPLNLLKLR